MGSVTRAITETSSPSLGARPSPIRMDERGGSRLSSFSASTNRLRLAARSRYLSAPRYEPQSCIFRGLSRTNWRQQANGGPASRFEGTARDDPRFGGRRDDEGRR